MREAPQLIADGMEGRATTGGRPTAAAAASMGGGRVEERQGLALSDESIVHLLQNWSQFVPAN